MDRILKLRATGIESVEASEETVILDERSELYLATNSTGSVLWAALKDGTTQDTLAELLVQRFGIGRNQANQDVQAFIDQLKELDLIDESPSGESAGHSRDSEGTPE